MGQSLTDKYKKGGQGTGLIIWQKRGRTKKGTGLIFCVTWEKNGTIFNFQFSKKRTPGYSRLSFGEKGQSCRLMTEKIPVFALTSFRLRTNELRRTGRRGKHVMGKAIEYLLPTARRFIATEALFAFERNFIISLLHSRSSATTIMQWNLVPTATSHLIQ